RPGAKPCTVCRRPKTARKLPSDKIDICFSSFLRFSFIINDRPGEINSQPKNPGKCFLKVDFRPPTLYNNGNWKKR
ncbi:MAG: hypothetical protein IIZ68_01210, partial [Clostridia bacterium]|nr:hypothetical protein [Clostridia bacterium]